MLSATKAVKRNRRPHLYRYLVLLPVLVVVLAVACGSDDDDASASLAAATAANGDPAGLVLIDGDGDRHVLRIEVADSRDERAVGLSKRESLDADAGMFFVFTERGLGFWMKDTLIPLSVAFIARCGEIIHIEDMEPQTLDLHQAEGNYSFGLEVNQGWFADNGIGVGDQVEIPEPYYYRGCD